MKLAIYSEDNIGHFGLSLENYCHFTSPIRRYSDLVVQRLIAKETPANHPLATVAKMISEQERVSAKAESSVSKLKKLRLLLEAHTKDPKRQYDAIITHIKPKGIIFELQELMMEGFLPLKALDQSYTFAKKEIALLGKSKGDKIALFTPLTVSLKEVDIISQVTVFELVAIDK